MRGVSLLPNSRAHTHYNFEMFTVISKKSWQICYLQILGSLVGSSPTAGHCDRGFLGFYQFHQANYTETIRPLLAIFPMLALTKSARRGTAFLKPIKTAFFFAQTKRTKQCSDEQFYKNRKVCRILANCLGVYVIQ